MAEFFFANGVLIYQEEWEKIVNFLEKMAFNFLLDMSWFLHF